MSKKHETSFGGLVYSTNKDAMQPEESFTEYPTLPPNKQKLRVRTDSKHRAGKLVTLVEGFEGTTADMESLAKVLKTKCGAGGSVKDGQIIVQGDYKEKIILLLKSLGYTMTK